MINNLKSMFSSIKFISKKIFSRISLKHFISDVYFSFLSYFRRYLQRRMVAEKKFIRSIFDYFSDKLDEIEYKKLAPRRHILFNEEEKQFLDLNIKCSKRIKRNKEKGYIQKEVFSCKFKNIKFFGHSGGFTFGKKPLLESTATLNRLRNYTFTVNTPLLIHRQMKGVFTSLMHIENHIYYHFLFEGIPRFYGILQIEEPEINLIIPENTAKWQIEIFKIFLDKRFKLLPIKKNEVWELENYYFPSFWHVDCSAYIPRELLNFFRNKIFEYYKIDTNIKRNRRLILSREKVKHRHILNRKQFLNLLKKYNFENVHPQDMTFKEQVELFNSAEIVIGMEGSAFTNVVFGTNLKVVVIFPSNYITTHWMLSSKSLNFTYKYTIGYNSTPKFDCKVDLDEVEKIIKELLEN